MKTIERDELTQKLERGDDFLLIEVLGSDEYEALHLPGAINVPFGRDFAASVQRAAPDKKQTVVVYCQDSACEASAKAAAEMETLGYADVLDFAAGKSDWERAGLRVIRGEASPELDVSGEGESLHARAETDSQRPR